MMIALTDVCWENLLLWHALYDLQRQAGTEIGFELQVRRSILSNVGVSHGILVRHGVETIGKEVFKARSKATIDFCFFGAAKKT